jgi:hypothetical protein
MMLPALPELALQLQQVRTLKVSMAMKEDS